MIIDDSAMARQGIRASLAREADMEVIGLFADPLFALEKMHLQWPDIITLELKMPRMDGLTFLRKIMSEHPTPMVVCSSLTEPGAEASMEALAAGAVSVIAKPRLGLQQFFSNPANGLAHAVRAAARMNRSAFGFALQSHATPPPRSAAPPHLPSGRNTAGIVAIGTSTGGTQALESVLTTLPKTSAGIVIVQHMPEKFTAMFAARLNSICQIEVREAHDGDRVMPGCALIAPGGRHMLLKRNGTQYAVEVTDGPLVNRHKPSVDVLFHSVAQMAGQNALGIIMTGMGDDGARGLCEIHQTGARTLAQDEASCVVYGMPREAVRLGGVDRSLPLNQIAQEIMAFR
ncbi:MAG: chemotaxis response regulator protein-glutamate methylesterase [Sterolibacterium sp.]|nr:chemotaxis response regulator protein-glutamate methylesterase [Sterolibacterium sp.]